MFAIERQNLIQNMLQQSGAVTISELAVRFSVSSETIRRDFLEMEKKGLLYRIHGGAVNAGNKKVPSTTEIA